jgi:CDP-diacylglycerol--glycerol-3-phosphate 3-phosphatidyltransferase
VPQAAEESDPPPISTRLEKLRLPSRRKQYTQTGRDLVQPLVRTLMRAGVTPDALTLAGLAGAAATAGLVISRHWLIAGFVFVAASLMDMLDGSLARMSGKASDVGAFMDSTLDRLAEGLVLGAIGVVLARDGHWWAVGSCFLALTASFLVSYTRARAEGLGVEGDLGGLMSRPERLVLVGAGIFLAPIGHALEIVITVLAALSLVTVGQRIRNARRALQHRQQARRLS